MQGNYRVLRDMILIFRNNGGGSRGKGYRDRKGKWETGSEMVSKEATEMNYISCVPLSFLEETCQQTRHSMLYQTSSISILTPKRPYYFLKHEVIICSVSILCPLHEWKRGLYTSS